MTAALQPAREAFDGWNIWACACNDYSSLQGSANLKFVDRPVVALVSLDKVVTGHTMPIGFHFSEQGVKYAMMGKIENFSVHNFVVKPRDGVQVVEPMIELTAEHPHKPLATPHKHEQARRRHEFGHGLKDVVRKVAHGHLQYVY